MGQCRQDTRYVWYNFAKQTAKSRNAVYGYSTSTNECTVQCPNERCRNDEAYWYQLQIRSADEPMTAFYKVGLVLGNEERPLMISSVPSVPKNGENKLGLSALHSRSLGASAIYPFSFHDFILCVFAVISSARRYTARVEKFTTASTPLA